MKRKPYACIFGLMVLLIVACMLSNKGVVPIAASLITTVYVDPLSSYAEAGELFTIDIKVADVENLFGWAVNQSFDPNILQFINVTEGDFLKGQPEGTWSPAPRVNNTEGWALFGWYTQGEYPEGVSGSGWLATVEFLVVGIGESILNITHPATQLIEMKPVGGGYLPSLIPCAKENGYFTNLLEPCVFGVFPTIIRFPEVGDEFQVRVNITEVEDLASWEFKLRWDPAILVCDDNFTYTLLWTEYVGPVKPEDYPIVDNQTGRFWTSMAVGGTAATFNGSTTIIELNFTGIARGMSFLEFTSVILLNSEGKWIPCSTQNGIAYVTELPVHNIDTGLDYLKIQDAIDAYQTHGGHRILVDNGTYTESLVVDKAVALIGESKNAIILGEISVESNNVIIRSFTVRNGGVRIGSYFKPAINVTVRENALVNGGISIYALPSDPSSFFGNNTVMENSIVNASLGIHVLESEGNRIIGNIVGNSSVGILVEGDFTVVSDNVVENGGVGMHLASLNNTITLNNLTNNSYNFGFDLSSPHPNHIDTSNTVNGNPIRYITNESDILIGPSSYTDVGYLALIDCFNITVKDMVFEGNGQGVLLDGCRGSALRNNTIADNVYGIDVRRCTESEIAGNTVSRNGLGMSFRESNFSYIGNNTFDNNKRTHINELFMQVYGWLRIGFGWHSGSLSMLGSSSNIIAANTFSNSDRGLDLWGCTNNTLRNNAMDGNVLNFGVLHYPPAHPEFFINDIDTSNTVNGKAIVYLMNECGEQVPDNAGYVGIINCTDITIRSLHLSDNWQGILSVSSNNSLISGNRINGCPSGIVLTENYGLPETVFHSTNITVHNNTVTYCGVGLSLHGGERNIASRNDLSSNIVGISIKGASHNTISQNTMTNCTNWDPEKIPHEAWRFAVGPLGAAGISIETSNNTIVGNTMSNSSRGMTVGMYGQHANNTIYHNNFINNAYQLQIDSMNDWNASYPIAGNFLSDYSGNDTYGGLHQNVTGRDGIGDSPYPLGKWVDPGLPPEFRTQKDSYPLMNPWTVLSAEGDIDGDGDIDPEDFSVYAGAYGTILGEPYYHARADMDQDGDVDPYDLHTIARNYSKTTQAYNELNEHYSYNNLDQSIPICLLTFLLLLRIARLTMTSPHSGTLPPLKRTARNNRKKED